MKNICFYFQVHQPFRLRHYGAFDVWKNTSYFDENKNAEIFRKVARKSYLPMNALLLDLIQKHPEFRVSFSLSGVFLEQCELYGTDVLESFQKLVQTGQVEILAETYYHSLAFLYSKTEFAKQIHLHRHKIKKYFGINPQVFRNTELIYTNELWNFVQALGFKWVIAEGADRILKWRSPNLVYEVKQHKLSDNLQTIAQKYRIHQPQKAKLLLKNYKLSDDIAFRFGNQNWEEHPLSTEKFTEWVQATTGETINLFMDYETFGEHQWEDTGIFDFMRHLPNKIIEHWIQFKTPTEVIQSYEPQAEIDMHHPVSWADIERDLSAWIGNDMQENALNAIYHLEKKLYNLDQTGKFQQILETWRKLQTSDQFYYMCTKYWADGDVHKYFSPYESPYDAYIIFMNVLQDFEERVSLLKEKHLITNN